VSNVPRLSDSARQQIRVMAHTYPARRTALLPALKLAQGEIGYLPPTVTAEVADLVGVPHAAAAELVAFYTMLHDHPEGTVQVVVCAQLPCALKGANRLLRDLAAGLGIKPGQTTPDGAVTLERTSECFGACHRAPMARVNDEYYENLDPEATQGLLTQLRTVPNGRTRLENR
jgi:NADH-quinone oxidoreductase subunit E